jgi:allophanate hydrolase
MSGTLAVLAPGIHTTVQDLGRLGYQALGVPVSGALDPVALRLVNGLVGNPPGTGGLEFLYKGPTLEVAAESVRVAVAGCELEVLGEAARRIPPWQSVSLVRGTRFGLGATRDSSCGYIAIEGGLALTEVMGSQSTYARAGFGGFEGRALRAGDRLPLARQEVEARSEIRLAAPPDRRAPRRVRVVLGPQDAHFTEAALATFLAESFTVSKDADRMGLRLDGPGLSHARGYDIASDGIATGAIQVPGSGRPIIMLADHQTTGGYPKIATVVSADLPAVGRLRPGDSIAFRAVSTGEAEAARRSLEADIERTARNRASAIRSGELNEAALYASNLVSGIVSVTD